MKSNRCLYQDSSTSQSLDNYKIIVCTNPKYSHSTYILETSNEAQAQMAEASARMRKITRDETDKKRVQQLWISVKDRLPERGTLVLCACRANIYEVLKFDGNGWIHDPMHDYMLGFVTHWMPLPELPKDGEHCG